ncbi:MAG TPA: trigger factor [Holophagaceae bacterium]|nr:trigger factor [Holophagaceae bacterium]
MSVNVAQHSATRFSLELSVPAAEVSAAFNEVVSKIAPKVRIPGFRPGKAPKTVLLQKYGQEIHQDVAQQLMERHFWAKAQEAGVMPISQPALEKVELRDGQEATFKAQFDVAPEVPLPEYKGLKVKKQKRAIDTDAVAEHLEGLRQRANKFLPVEGASEIGHLVSCDIKVLPEGEKGKPAKAISYKDQVIELKADRPFDANLVGLKADDTKTFTVTHDADPAQAPNPSLAGKTITYTITVKEIHNRVLPELNDDLAKDLGQYQTLAELKEGVKKDLEEAAERDAVARVQTVILDQLLDAAKFEAPRSMVGLQLDDYCQEFARTVQQQGVDPRRVNWQAYRQHRLRDAERAVRSGYLLQAIGNAEDIQVTDEEIDADVRAFMDENKDQEPFTAFKANLEQRGATTEIKGRIRTDKIFERLLSSATVTEELLDKEAFLKVVELERKREAGEAVERFDAGGLEGGDLAEQEGGAPAHHHEHVHGPDCDHDHDHEEKPKKAAKKAAPKAEPEAAEEKPAKKAAAKKAEPESEEKPKKAAPKKKAE